jgi:hypothetical protein
MGLFLIEKRHQACIMDKYIMLNARGIAERYDLLQNMSQIQTVTVSRSVISAILILLFI